MDCGPLSRLSLILLINFICRSIYDLKCNDVVLLCSPLTFDPSIVEIFVTLSCGACLLIVPEHVKLQSKKLLSLIYKRNKVTVMQVRSVQLNLTTVTRCSKQFIKKYDLRIKCNLFYLWNLGNPLTNTENIHWWSEEHNFEWNFQFEDTSFGRRRVSSPQSDEVMACCRQQDAVDQFVWNHRGLLLVVLPLPEWKTNLVMWHIAVLVYNIFWEHFTFVIELMQI